MSILDSVEKINKDDEKLLEKKIPPGVLLVVTYKNNEQELFYVEKEVGKATIQAIWDALESGQIPFAVCINNDPQEDVCIGDKIEDFRGILIIDENVRAVRLINPEDLPNED